MPSDISITVLKRTNLACTNVAYLSRFAPSADDGNRRDIISHADLRIFTEIVAFTCRRIHCFTPHLLSTTWRAANGPTMDEESFLQV
uniref:Uncharacterized protein n=1 Tax=Mesocestoides corti TaxID=53468 RepID=A0A5K3G046_MESCO